MAREDDDKVLLDNFKGLYARGLPDDVPPDHAQDCLNLMFSSQGQVGTRPGVEESLALGYAGGKVRRFFMSPYGLLVLDDAGNIYIDGGAAPLFSLAGMSDFAALTMFGRTYISPNDGIGGFYSSYLQVWDGTNIRNAAGAAPVWVNVGAADGAAGKVVKGIHKIMVVYETNTGFLTHPGPKEADHNIEDITPGNLTILQVTGHGIAGGSVRMIDGGIDKWAPLTGDWVISVVDADHISIPLNSTGFGPMVGHPIIVGLENPTVYNAPGDKKINLTNIPTGPAYITKRHIIATKADEEEFFFVPDAIIADNSTAVLTVDFDDEELIASADYLFDLMEKIPSGTCLTKYRGRLVIVGAFPNVDKALVSRVGEPEAYSTVSGYIQVPSQADGNNLQTAFVLRDVLYLCKFVGIHVTEDNGGEPSTWGADGMADGAVGAYHYGVSTFTASQPARDTGDIVLLASKAGLYLFDGVVRRPELTWKVQDIWQRVKLEDFKRVTVVHDIWKHLIFIALPLDGNGEPNYLLVGDYSDGWGADTMKWTPWRFPKNASTIGMFYYTDNLYKLRYGTLDAEAGSIWGVTEGATNDVGVAIDSYWKSALLSKNVGVNTFTMLQFRARGNGNLVLGVSGEDDNGAQVPPSLALSAAPGKELARVINFVNEKIAVKFGTNEAGHKMQVDRLVIYYNEVWPVRPA